MQLLTEQGRFGTTVGQGSFAVLLAQDIAVVPILFVVGTFGAHVSGSPLLFPLTNREHSQWFRTQSKEIDPRSTKTQKSVDVSLFPLDFWGPQSGTELDT